MQSFSLWKNHALLSNYYVISVNNVVSWKVIIDNLMSQDKFMFRSLLSRIPTSSSTGMVNIFSSLEIVCIVTILNNLSIGKSSKS